MASFQKHLEKNIKGVKELSNFLASKKSQLRNENNIKIYEYFHAKILPLVDEPYYASIVKFLSKAYRSKASADDVIKQIDDALAELKNQPQLDTESEEVEMITPQPVVTTPRNKSNSPIKVEPTTPTHAVVEKKKKAKPKSRAKAVTP